ncbi:hypothetical protein HDU97_007244 [Phlyctochytrium planicorne]|nr:hypothetical protein HDU97_007244 [Phlyctochytrium planicorne]
MDNNNPFQDEGTQTPPTRPLSMEQQRRRQQQRQSVMSQNPMPRYFPSAASRSGVPDMNDDPFANNSNGIRSAPDSSNYAPLVHNQPFHLQPPQGITRDRSVSDSLANHHSGGGGGSGFAMAPPMSPRRPNLDHQNIQTLNGASSPGAQNRARSASHNVYPSPASSPMQPINNAHSPSHFSPAWSPSNHNNISSSNNSTNSNSSTPNSASPLVMSAQPPAMSTPPPLLQHQHQQQQQQAMMNVVDNRLRSASHGSSTPMQPFNPATSPSNRIMDQQQQLQHNNQLLAPSFNNPNRFRSNSALPQGAGLHYVPPASADALRSAPPLALLNPVSSPHAVSALAGSPELNGRFRSASQPGMPSPLPPQDGIQLQQLQPYHHNHHNQQPPQQLQPPSPSNWEPIVARAIKHFAVYTGDLTSLLKRVTGFHRVDMLVVAADEVGSLNLASGKGQMRSTTPNVPFHPVVGPDGHAVDDYDTQLSAGVRTPQSPRMPRASSTASLKNYFSKPFRSPSASTPNGPPNLDDHNPTDDPSPQHLTTTYLLKLSHHFKHITVMINVGQVYATYDASKRKLGSSFSKFFVGHVREVLNEAKFPVAGFVLMGLEEAGKLHPSGDSMIVKLIAALRGERDVAGNGGDKKGKMRALYLDAHGVSVWDKIRDDINGIFFKNNVMTEKGTFRARFGGDRVEFDEIANRLKIEITLRDDFMVFGIESVYGGPDRVDAALTRQAISWYRGLGFLFWFCHAGTPPAPGAPHEFALQQQNGGSGGGDKDAYGRYVDDVKPPKLNSLGDDSIFELAVHASVKSVKAVVEKNYRDIRRNGRGFRNGNKSAGTNNTSGTSGGFPMSAASTGGPITPMVWASLLDRPMPEPSARFFAGVRRLLDGVHESHFEDVIYERVEVLHPGYFRDVNGGNGNGGAANDALSYTSSVSGSGAGGAGGKDLAVLGGFGPAEEIAYVKDMLESLREMPINLVRNLVALLERERVRLAASASGLMVATSSGKGAYSPAVSSNPMSPTSANTISFPEEAARKRTSFAVLGGSGGGMGSQDVVSTPFGNGGGYQHQATTIVMGLGSKSTEARRDRLATLLKRNLVDLLSKKLVASLKKNVDVDSGSFNPKYLQCIETLETFVKDPKPAAAWAAAMSGCGIMLGGSSPSGASDLGIVRGTNEIKALVKDLLEGLTDGNINVWLASKAAFLSGEVEDGKIEGEVPETVWAFGEVRNESIHIYVADNVPNVIEIILHVFAKLVLGWSTGRCLVLEGLIGSQSNLNDDDAFPIPARFPIEIESFSHSARLRLIRNTGTVIEGIRNATDLTSGEVVYLTHLTNYVSNLSEQILVDRQAYEDLKLSWAKTGYAPMNDLEVALVEVVGKCTFDSNGSKRFLSVMETLKEIVTSVPAVSTESHALCLLFMSIQKAIRRCAYMELQVSLQNKNAIFLPDADQVAVGLEMTTTQENIRTVFELTSLQLSGPMHVALRKMAFKEIKDTSGSKKERRPSRGDVSPAASPVPGRRKKKGGDDEGHAAGHKKRKDEGHVMEKKITNAYLFIYPILIDLILVRLIGSGIFYSDRMNVSAQYSITLIFLIMYPIVGGVMNSIGRTVTYYFYQKSIPLMIAAFIRRLASGVIVSVCGSVVVAGIDYFLNRNYITLVLTFFYSIGFCLYMVFLCGLVSFKDPDDYFFKSPGPRVVILTVPILSVSGFISRFAFKNDSKSTIVWAIYTVVILLTVFYMAWNYRRIAITYLNWPDSIDVTTKASIIELYVKEASAKPTQEEGEDIESFERRKRRWERTAIEWWMERLEKAMSSKKMRSNEPPIVKKRVQQRRWEDMLMQWYFERAGSTPPKRYSTEWDIALKQALGELKKKYNVEKLNRGDILFDFESPAIAFGFLYFIIIFVDKWCLLFVTGKAALFLPTEDISKGYVAGVLYGTIFLLIASGILELTLSFMYDKQKGIIQKSLSQVKSMDKMVEDHWFNLRSIYKGELRRFLLFTLAIFLIVTAPVVIFNRDQNTLMVYAATSFGYFGLLVGLFHKLFITSDEKFLNRWMLIGMVVSIVTICVLLKITKNMLWAAGTITINGWLFGLACLATYSKETLATVHYRITISPTLTSSGQRMIGHPQSQGIQERTDDLAIRLLANKSRFTVLLPTSELGRKVTKKIQNSLYRVTMLAPTHVLNVAFPTARALADSIVARFFEKELVVHLVPARIEVGVVQYHAISINENNILHIFFDGPDTDVGWSNDDIENLCECIVHESAEDFGMSHADACAVEALISLDEGTNMNVNVLADWVPNRVQKYIANANASVQRRLVNSTENVVDAKAALSVEMDRHWGRDDGISHYDRCAMIALTKDWNLIFKSATEYSVLPEHIDYTACDSVLNVRDGNDKITLRMALARSLISGILANNIQRLCQNSKVGKGLNRFQSSRRTQRKRNRISQFIGTISRSGASKDAEVYVEDIISGSLGRKKHMQDVNLASHKVQSNFFTRTTGAIIDAVVAFFLSITADVRFGRELAVTPWLVRAPLALLYFISRKLVGMLTQIFIYRKLPSISRILNRNEKGVFRIITMGFDSESHRIKLRRVDAFNSASQTIVSMVESHKKENQPSKALIEDADPEADLLLVRYTGPKPDNWEVNAKEKALSRGFFEKVEGGGRNPFRLIQENYYDGSGVKVIRKHTYEYPDKVSVFPQRRKVYLVEYNGDQFSKKFLSEIHSFSTEAWYSVQSASIKRMHKPSKKYIHIYAEYPDASVEGPQRIFYKSKYPQEWTLVLKSTSSITTDGSPNFAFAEFSRAGEDGFYRTIFDYSHPQHPTMTSVFVRTSGTRMDLASQNKMDLSMAMVTDPGEPVATPIEVLEDHFGLLSLTPPIDFHLSSELADAGIRSRTKRKWSIVPPFVRSLQIEYVSGPCATLRKREDLWTAWRAGKIPGVFAREIDERFLRAEPILQSYWRHRDWGNIAACRAVLSEQKQVLDVALKVPDRPVTRTHLKIRFSDLYMLGVGGDAHQVFSFDDHSKNLDMDEEKQSKGIVSTLGRLTFGRTLPFASAQVQKSKVDGTRLNVMNVDSGTWPTGGGGVGSCRRDLIDGLSRIRWNTIAEIGSAEAVQKDYQIERNIDSITYVVLWDVDFGTPNENVYRTENQKQLRRKQRATTDRVVRDLFVPLVEKLIEGCFCPEIPANMIGEYENVFVNLYHFFQMYDWTTAWNHVGTQEAWIQGWLKGGSKLWENGQLHDLETPTLQQIDILFGLITRLLLPLTVKLAKIPVVHASHHGIQAIIGVVAKKVHGSSLVVWDHGILWRERLFGLCGDGMPRFTQNGFIGISRLVGRVVFARADYITPCTSIQNVDWEAWIGGGKHGSRLDTALMSTKINPVLNGMDLSKFSVKRHLELEQPSAVMLSHISPVKDIMNAIMAASYIVKEFKLTSYKLNIYGSPEKEPPYTTDCQAAIVNLNLSENVILCGLGSPSAVLPTGWVFVNSSITEGLPLALGEAGLCGLPVACTDVGGSREVVSNIAKGEVYGAIVPPSKPRQLAIAQLKVLAMTDGLSKVAEPGTDIEDLTLDELVARGPGELEKRIMDERIKDLRRKLGMRLRERTISVFSIARYLREHEQILWCANYRSSLV